MKRLVGVICLSLLLATGAGAATITYVALLDGPSENPVNPSLGTGTATLIIDTTANTASLSVTFGGLSSPTQAAHVHCCVTPPTNVGIAIASANFPIGVLQGSFSANYDLLNGLIWNGTFLINNGGTATGAMNALLAGLASGQAYYNIHTSASPGGEIRGFFAVPEPAAALLLGVAGAWAMRARVGAQKRY
jgi:CHRD domain